MNVQKKAQIIKEYEAEKPKLISGLANGTITQEQFDEWDQASRPIRAYEIAKKYDDSVKAEEEAKVKKELMELEFELNSRLKGMESQVAGQREVVKEDRKDARVDRQAMHQAALVEQRKQGDSLKKFESSGNDIVTGDIGLNL